MWNISDFYWFCEFWLRFYDFYSYSHDHILYELWLYDYLPYGHSLDELFLYRLVLQIKKVKTFDGLYYDYEYCSSYYQ